MSERIDQLPHQSDTQPSMLVMIGDPATGKLYRITIAELLAELQFPEGNGDVEAEAAIRSAADIALQNAINQEAINRINGDNNEANQRINGDNNLQLNINAEANARGVADGILQNAITNEINARQQADNDLQQQIDDLELAAGASIDDTTPSTSKVYSSQKTQDLLDTKLDSSAYNDRFKGKYTTLAALQSAHPTANAGDYAQVDTGAGNDVINYNYDTEDGWVEGGSGSAATTTDELPEGSTNLYFTDARARNATKEVFERTTSASAVTISNTTTIFNLDPATTTASQTVTLPASPADLRIVKIVFGGTITSGAVVTALTIAPNSGQTAPLAPSGVKAEVGESVSFQYYDTDKIWYRLN